MTLSRNLLYPRIAALHKLVKATSVRSIKTSACLSSGHHLEHWWGPEKAAGREVVGFGSTGDEVYQDRLDYWYPAIRFRVEDDTIKPIRAKEMGDWKALTLDEKKMLYRYSFRQTLAEFEAPSGYWKVMTAATCAIIALATFYSLLLHKFVYPELPPTFQNEYKEAQVERMLVLQKGTFLGPAKYYDYENNRWKQ